MQTLRIGPNFSVVICTRRSVGIIPKILVGNGISRNTIPNLWILFLDCGLFSLS